MAAALRATLNCTTSRPVLVQDENGLGGGAAALKERRKMIVNSITVKPNELRSGDVMICTVTLHMIANGDGRLLYRMYRCSHGASEHEGVPQGTRLGNEEALQRELFPVVGWADAKPDLR